MKITDSPSPADDPNVNADEDVDSVQDDDQSEPSAFSQVLAKKKGEEAESSSSKSGKRPESGFDRTVAGLMQDQPKFDLAMQAAPVQSSRTVTLPTDLQHLVREISVAVNAAGNQQVHIELNSNALKGLHIRIEKQEQGVAIQFQTASDDVARLLSRNVDALSQGLADRGVNVADIHVARPQESSRSRDDKGRSNQGGRWQGGRQGGGRR